MPHRTNSRTTATATTTTGTATQSMIPPSLEEGGFEVADSKSGDSTGERRVREKRRLRVWAPTVGGVGSAGGILE